MVRARQDVIVEPGRAVVLGVDCAHIPRWVPVFQEDRTTREKDRWVELNTGIAAVIPAWRVLNLLNQNHLVKHREQQDRELDAEHKASRTAISDTD